MQLVFVVEAELCFDDLCFELLRANAPDSNLTAADLDRDGSMELITATDTYGCDDPYVTVWRRESDLVWTRGDEQASHRVGGALFTLDADADGDLDVAVDLEVLPGDGAGSLARAVDLDHLDVRVLSVIRGRQGVYTFNHVGLHNHGDVPHGSFYRLHSFIEGTLRVGSLQHQYDSQPHAVGPDDTLIGRGGLDGCSILSVPDDWRGGPSELLRLPGGGCGGWTRLDLDDDSTQDLAVSVSGGPNWPTRVAALRISDEGDVSLLSSALFEMPVSASRLFAGNVDDDAREDLWIEDINGYDAPARTFLATRSELGWEVRGPLLGLAFGPSTEPADLDGDGLAELIWFDEGAVVLRRSGVVPP